MAWASGAFRRCCAPISCKSARPPWALTGRKVDDVHSPRSREATELVGHANTLTHGEVTEEVR